MQITSVRDRLATLGQGVSRSTPIKTFQASELAVKAGVQNTTLIGMVAKGHGVETLCLFLRLTPANLLARIVALNLYTPHSNAVRRTSGVRNAWQVGEIRKLIDYWELNLSSQCISDKLGRSPGSIRSKARWLGLPRRPRNTIVSDYTELPTQPAPAKRTRWDNTLSTQVIDRILAYQHYKAVARDLGLTPAQVRSKIQVLGLPKDRDRKLLVMDYRPDSPEAKALRAKHVIRRCEEWGRVFVAERTTRPAYCPAFRKTEEYRHRFAMFG